MIDIQLNHHITIENDTFRSEKCRNSFFFPFCEGNLQWYLTESSIRKLALNWGPTYVESRPGLYNVITLRIAILRRIWYVIFTTS